MSEGQELADIEGAFEKSKGDRMKAKHALESAKGKYHTQLVARREAGETMTIADLKALESSAIDEVESVKQAYLSFIDADTIYRQKKVLWEDAKRRYWDNKGQSYSH